MLANGEIEGIFALVFIDESVDVELIHPRRGLSSKLDQAINYLYQIF
jgi:hypothetical protein